MPILLWHFVTWQEGMMLKKKKIICPYCGYEMPVFYDEGAVSKGVYIRCKGRNCKKVFEIKISVK